MSSVPIFRYYVTLYLSVCLFFNIILITYFLWEESWWDGAKMYGAGHNHLKDWNDSGETILSCSYISRISNITFLRSGWTKAVYKGQIDNLTLAIKTVNTNGHDMKDCCQNKVDVSICYARAANKIMKEELLLKELTHPNIIKVYGSCMPGSNYSPGPPVSGVVTLVTELGQPFDMIQILQMTFEQRLLIASGLIDILQHLSHCSLGSLLMQDFRRDQFVIVDGVLKLSDVDDIAIGETRCKQSSDCIITNTEGQTVSIVDCQSGFCLGYNNRANNIKAAQHFMKILLPYGAPEPLQPAAQDILNAMLSGNVESSVIYSKFKELENSYIHGSYLLPEYKKCIEEYDVIHEFSLHDGDFTCKNTQTDGYCIQSVTSEVEAAWICHHIPQCVAFFKTKDKTWTGRQIVIFKKEIIGKYTDGNAVLYVRRGQG